MQRKPRIRIPTHAKDRWRERVHPFFIRMAEQLKKIEELSKSPSAADRAQAQQLVCNPPQEMVDEARELSVALPNQDIQPDVAIVALGLEDVPPDQPITPAIFMLHWLARCKTGKTLAQLRRDALTDFKVSQQLLSVSRDFERWRFGKVHPDGIGLRIDDTHFSVMVCGFDFGLKDLTPDELADCFDALCSCGKTDHSPDNLRKLRSRILAMLTKASELGMIQGE